MGIKEWIEEAFVKFAFKLLNAADSGCHSIAANEYAADHPLGEDVRRPIQSWCKGFLDGWRRKYKQQFGIYHPFLKKRKKETCE